MSRTASIYLRPAGFVDAPFAYDRQVARLAGGSLWFSACEAIVSMGASRTSTVLVPVVELDAFIGRLPETLATQARGIWSRLIAPRSPMTLGDRTLRLDQPLLLGILNMTPDSFSGDGRSADVDAALDQAFAMGKAGASIIDVGGESTRPGAATVWEGDEIARIEPIVRRPAAGGALVSVDTRKAAVMAAALDAGAHIVNDVSALTYDPLSLEVLAARDCPVVLMHHQGDPATMQADPRYDDVLLDVYDWLEARIESATAAGIARARIILDPGIGFGKTLRHNLQLLNGLALFHGLGCPLLLGASRKRIIGALSNEAPVDQRLGGSVALALHGAQMGAQLLRVHDVAETMQAIRVWRGLRDEALTPIF